MKSSNGSHFWSGLINTNPPQIAIGSSGKEKFSLPIANLSNPVVDTTGAGDSFAGGFIGNIEKTNIIDAVIAGSVIASFTVSAFGVDGLLNIDEKEINNRINYIKSLMKD